MPFRNPLVAALAIAAAGLVTHGQAQAQTAIHADAPQRGQLDARSPRADDGTPYVLYLYRGRPGERVRVRMDSDAFDPYLAVGSTAAPGCSEDCRMDDDGGGGLNAALVYRLGDTGQVQIRANAIEPDASGAFTLTVSPLPAQAAPAVSALVPGQTAQGRLGDESPQDEDEQPYQLWRLQGQPGQAVVVRMESTDFDAYLESGSQGEDGFQVEHEDDDGGGGLNARLHLTLDADGQALLRTRSLGGEPGAYTIAAALPTPPRPVTVASLPLGQSIRGRLDDNDPFTGPDEILYDVYRIQGRPGQRVIVRMESADFDPVLRWGVYEGERFVQDQFDDDSGGGTSAQFIVTLDADGEGRLQASSYAAAQGSYTLSATAAPRGGN